jgi:hypothetical protein
LVIEVAAARIRLFGRKKAVLAASWNDAGDRHAEADAQ